MSRNWSTVCLEIFCLISSVVSVRIFSFLFSFYSVLLKNFHFYSVSIQFSRKILITIQFLFSSFGKCSVSIQFLFSFYSVSIQLIFRKLIIFLISKKWNNINYRLLKNKIAIQKCLHWFKVQSYSFI